ncbi:MAG: uroporphyrinogen-III synthase [Chloroflexi bacterium]|nr:MAG: uroporphyrinogen-III synthase [Chloroflexota bacterium]
MPEQKEGTLPLQHKRVLVTRTRDQASVLSEKLRSLGALPVEFPTIRIVPPHDWSALDSALRCLYGEGNRSYDWLIFTSANGVKLCLERLQTLGYEPQALSNVRVATIGPATAATLAQYGVKTNLVPDEYIAEEVATALIKDVYKRGTLIAGQRILLARAAEARKVLVTELQEAGAIVDDVAAYHTLPVAADDEHGRAVLQLLRQHQLEILTFTSSSTVRNFLVWLNHCTQDSPALADELATILAHTTIASIGPITSQTARELGLHVDIEAQEFTIDGLVQAIVQVERGIKI